MTTPTLRSSDLEELIEAIEGTASSPVELLTQASPHKLRPVLGSAWKVEGKRLTPGLEHEIKLFEERRAFYANLVSDLHAMVRSPEWFVHVKGIIINEDYPPGWIRNGNDLDLIVDGSETAWELAAHLVSRNWNVEAVGMKRIQGKDLPAISLERESPDPQAIAPYKIDIAAFWAAGNSKAPSQTNPPLPLGDFRGLTLLSLVEERLQRQYCGRDFLDAFLLMSKMSPLHLKECLRRAAETGRLPEWKELTGIMSELLGVPQAIPATSFTLRFKSIMSRFIHRLRGIRPTAILLTFLQFIANLTNYRYRITTRAGIVQLALRSGKAIQGIPLSPGTFPLKRRLIPPIEILETPAGSFLLTCGPVRREELLEAFNKHSMTHSEPNKRGQFPRLQS